ncbi:MAG: hypothetical protein KJO75_22340 [Dactylosporangium sp.]|nr:hypothetical protein [Dactylosporangium sp.]
MAAGIATMLTVPIATPAAAELPPEDDGFSIAALAWEQAAIDVRSGSASVALEWVIVNDDAEATTMSGTVSVRMADAQDRTYIGEAYDIDYGLPGWHEVVPVEGSAQRSSYRASIPIPQYAARSHAHWIVTRVTAAEDGEEAEVFTGEDLEDFAIGLRATTLVDTTPPTFTKFNLSEGVRDNPYLYVGDVPAAKGYAFNVLDDQSGFWKGKVELTGPTGQTSVTAFELTSGDYAGSTRCADRSPQPTGRITCFVMARLPAGAAEGTWYVSRLTLVDAAGNRVTAGDPEAPELIVSGNRTLRATAITADPTEVDNWRADGTTTVRVATEGAQGAIEFAEVVTSWIGGGCYAPGTAPTVDPDGMLSIPVVLEQKVDECTITGLFLRDEAGNVAIYGRESRGPELDIPLTRVPDPTPPQITAAALNRTTVPLAEVPTAGVTLTVTTDTEGAPLELTFVSLYDTGGALVCGATAARVPDEWGVLTMRVYLRSDIVPGTYTVALHLRDTLDRTSEYGAPGGSPMPGGPLTLTITA